jgi:hypothetical protein
LLFTSFELLEVLEANIGAFESKGKLSLYNNINI